jgi:hypothetical protein
MKKLSEVQERLFDTMCRSDVECVVIDTSTPSSSVPHIAMKDGRKIAGWSVKKQTLDSLYERGLVTRKFKCVGLAISWTYKAIG